jgi:hypothetical protein
MQSRCHESILSVDQPFTSHLFTSMGDKELVHNVHLLTSYQQQMDGFDVRVV